MTCADTPNDQTEPDGNRTRPAHKGTPPAHEVDLTRIVTRPRRRRTVSGAEVINGPAPEVDAAPERDETPPAPEADDTPDTPEAEVVAEVINGPAARIRRVGRVTSEQHWEIVRAELLQMVMQGYTCVQIAHECNVSPDTAYRWRRRLTDDLRKEATTMQPRDFIMESMTSIRMARAEAWERYRSSQSEKDRRAYLQIIIQTENQSTKLGATIGLFGGRDAEPMSPATYGDPVGDEYAEDARALQMMARAVLVAHDPQDDLFENPSRYDESEESDLASLLDEIVSSAEETS